MVYLQVHVHVCLLMTLAAWTVLILHIQIGSLHKAFIFALSNLIKLLQIWCYCGVFFVVVVFLQTGEKPG